MIDVQEAFRKALPTSTTSPRRPATLVQGAAAVGIPIVVTEQYPKGLGATVPEVAEHLPEGVEPLDKVRFSAAEADGFDLGGRDQALVCGIEAHVCVNQTVLDLLDEDVEVHVAADAVGSRTEANRELGLAKMERGGRRADQRRDGALRAARRLRRARVQAGPGARQVTDDATTRRGYVLLEDGTRFEGDLCGAAGDGARRGRLQHLDDRLPGGGHRPELRRARSSPSPIR